MLKLLVGLVSLGIIISIGGCGGGETADLSGGAPPTAAPKPVAAPVGREQASEAAPIPSTAPKEKPAAQANPAGNSSAVAKFVPVQVDEDNRDDVFIAHVGPNYQVVPNEAVSGSLSRDLFRTEVPDQGYSSSSFQIVSRPEESIGVQQPDYELPEGFTALTEFGYHSSGWPQRIQCNRDRMEMAYVPGGVFTQGTDGDNQEFGPEHSMYLNAFYMDLHEVTVSQFMQYRDYLVSQGSRVPPEPESLTLGPDYPAVGILYRDAAAYAETTEKELPSEAEWEKAARGPGSFDHPWGFGRPAWSVKRDFGQLDPVMSFSADKSPYGIYDLAGNAREWCYDWYAPNAYQIVLEQYGSVPRNWKGPRRKDDYRRVIRGSDPSWNVWHREGLEMSARDPSVGFRCVLRIKPSE